MFFFNIFSASRSILRDGQIERIEIFYNRSKLFYFQGSTPRMCEVYQGLV